MRTGIQSGRGRENFCSDDMLSELGPFLVGEKFLYTSAERWPHQCSVRKITIVGIWKFSFKNERAKLHHLQMTFAYGISMWRMLT